MRLSKLILLVFIGLITLAAFSNASSVSGIYVQKFKNAVVFIQIVVTPDGKVSGRGESVSVLPDGKPKKWSFPLEGSIDGNQISLKSNEIFGWGQALSGTVDGETLRLTSDNGQMTLLKSDLDTFAKEKSRLAASGASIASANQEAKYQAEAKDYLNRLTSYGQSLEADVSKLPQVESDADIFIKQTRKRRDNIVDQIKAHRAKLQFVSSNDVGEIESIIWGLISELEGLKSEYDANNHFAAIAYDKIQSNLENFKSYCDSWLAKYPSNSPLQCKNYPTYLASYQSSRANMKYRYSEAGKMFVFN